MSSTARALSVCPSGPIYIPPSSKLTFHRREEERRGGRASSRSIIRRTGASGGLGKVLRQHRETQQWAPISTGEQRVCMTLLTMIPPSGRVRRGSSEDEVISQFTNPPRGFRSRLPYNSPLHCRPSSLLPDSCPVVRAHNWSNSLPSFIVWGAVPRKSLPTDRPPDDLIVALS